MPKPCKPCFVTLPPRHPLADGAKGPYICHVLLSYHVIMHTIMCVSVYAFAAGCLALHCIAFHVGVCAIPDAMRCGCAVFVSHICCADCIGTWHDGCIINHEFLPCKALISHRGWLHCAMPCHWCGCFSLTYAMHLDMPWGVLLV